MHEKHSASIFYQKGDRMNILIVRVSAMGDVIHTLPALALIKYHLPNATIHWIVQDKAADILRDMPHIDKLWVIPNKYLSLGNLPTLYTTIKQLRAIHWDAIIDFQGLLKTTFITAQLRGKKFGFNYHHARCGLTALFNNITTDADYTNIIQKNLSLASFVCSHLTKQTHSPTVQSLVNQKQHTQVINNNSRWLHQNCGTHAIMISPNTTWESKHWPVEYWQTLFTQLSLHRYPTLLVGSTFGHQGATLATFIKHNNLDIAIAPAWSLRELIPVIQQTGLVIAPDTGLLHLADYLGVQTIGIFGPTLARRHGPFLQTRNIHNALQIQCPHLYEKKHGNMQKTGKNTTCMHTLKPDVVLAKIETIVGAKGMYAKATHSFNSSDTVM